MVLVALDVDYRDDHAVAAGVIADRWDDPAPRFERVARVATVAAYVPGRFFEREMPCLLAVLERLGQGIEGGSPTLVSIDVVVVDGYVTLDPAGRPGLGAHLFEALEGRVAVVGVAKTAFRSATHALPVLRGRSQRPLFVTAAGLDPAVAAARVAAMHGPHRVPTLLARADALCRSARPTSRSG